MSRPVLDPVRIHPAIEDSLSNFHADILHNVQAASNTNPVLVVGMAGNPYCRRARRTLDKAHIAYQYLEYGSYLSQWKQRLALKMWSGWPTFPMVFAKGVLIGGANDLDKLVSSGELQRLLGS